MIKTTVPGVSCPIKASLSEIIVIDTIEQKRKKVFIFLLNLRLLKIDPGICLIA